MRSIWHSSRRGDGLAAAAASGVAIFLFAAASAWADGAVVKGEILLPDPGLDAEARRADTVIEIRAEAAEGERKTEGAGTVATMKIEHGRFSPRVLAVATGAVVEFANLDDSIHNPLSSSMAKKFDLGMLARDERRSVTFDRPGVAHVVCKAEPKMEGFVVVADTPYFAAVGPGSGYQIGGLPPGAYLATAWNPSYETVTRRFEVAREREVVNLDLRFERRATP